MGVRIPPGIFMKNIPEFPNRKKAQAYVARLTGFCDYMDNVRFAYTDDVDAMKEYKRRQNDGCCGFVDIDIVIAGKPAKIGCNYGH